MTVNQLKRELEIVRKVLCAQNTFQMHDVFLSSEDQAVVDQAVKVILKYREQGKIAVSNGRMFIDDLSGEDAEVLDQVVRIYSDPNKRVKLH